MKRHGSIAILILLLSALSLFAQSGGGGGGGAGGGGRGGGRRGGSGSDFSQEPSKAPSAELTVQEFLLKRADLKGQVVELTFDEVISLKQVGSGYVAEVTYQTPRRSEGVTLLIPDEGLDFFEPLSDPGVRRTNKVYVHVMGRGVRALGTRYNSNRSEGDRYSW